MYRVIKRCVMFYGTSVVPYFLVSCFNSWHVHAVLGTASGASGPVRPAVAGPSDLTKQADHGQGITLLMLRLPIPSVNKVIAWNRKIWLQSCVRLNREMSVYRESTKRSKKKAGTTLGDCFSQVPVLYSQLSLNRHLYKMDTSVKRTPRVGP